MPSSQNQNSPLFKRYKFKSSICPFIERLYRTSLIVTGNPRAATILLQQMYRKAWNRYKTTDHIADFAFWLTGLVKQLIVSKFNDHRE